MLDCDVSTCVLSSPPALWCVSWGGCNSGMLRKLVHCQLPLPVCPQGQVSLPAEQGGVLRATYQPCRGEGTALDGHSASFIFPSSFLFLLLWLLRDCNFTLSCRVTVHCQVCLHQPCRGGSVHSTCIHTWSIIFFFLPSPSSCYIWGDHFIFWCCNSKICLLGTLGLTTFHSFSLSSPFSPTVLLLYNPSLLFPLLPTLPSLLPLPPPGCFGWCWYCCVAVCDSGGTSGQNQPQDPTFPSTNQDHHSDW